jgi:glucose/arabinose dehydrogenase
MGRRALNARMPSPAALAVSVLLALAGCRTATAGPRAVPAPAAVAAGVQLTRVAAGLAKPVALAVAPGDDGGRLFVAEQTGAIRIVRNGEVAATPFLDLTSRVSASAGTANSEQGLLGLAFHPAFAENRRFFVNLTDRKGDTRILSFAVAAGDPERADPASEREVMHVAQPYANHNGGHLAFGPDGRLYVGLGDGGFAGDPHGNGQNPEATLGKMWALAVGGDGAPTAPPRMVALGLRNPWRYSFDRASGDLWIADVGQNRFEEVDVLTPAMRTAAAPVNFGWNSVEGLHCFRGPTCDQSAFTAPVVEYGHAEGCSIVGGYVYRGRRLPALVGRYFFADYCTALIRSLVWDGTTVRDVWDWRDALDPEHRLAQLSSFGEDAAGELYLLSLSGDVYRFDPR